MVATGFIRKVHVYSSLGLVKLSSMYVDHILNYTPAVSAGNSTPL
jgi:hypothetical protein